MAKSLPPFGQDGDKPFSNRRSRAFGTMPIRTVIPNALTVLALCAGLTAIRFALEGRFEAAVTAIIIASVFDALDGRVARFLKGTSKFGAELDSLTDFVNFGVAPVIVLYLWTLSAIGGIGWIAVLGYAVCCALRLARFNVALEDPDKPAWSANYFTGVPAPAGALIVMLPLYLDFIGLSFLKALPLIVAIHCFAVAFLMVSRVPTFSGKRMGLRIERDMVLPILVFVGFVAAVVLNYPWYAFTAIALAYLAVLPVSIMRHRHHMLRSATVVEPVSNNLPID
ncbi:MAG: CDP-diacylglycerol--serine O-phosphatidyltransferase [Parvibaculum sp.]|nr:CDP-diacylglycerol--serine O-phosphatidyltransferase [Parvibaculum sp.]